MFNMALAAGRGVGMVFLRIGAVSGAGAVCLGAYGAHNRRFTGRSGCISLVGEENSRSVRTPRVGEAKMSKTATEKRYDLSVFYNTVKEEHRSPMKTKIRGEIPKWIDGSLYRNGGGMWEIGKDSYNHLFDAMTLLHRYRIKDGDVTYQSQFLRSDHYKKNMKYNRIVCTEFGTIAHKDPCLTLFERIAAYFKPPGGSDNCGVNMMYIGDELFALTETQYMRRVDPTTLDTTDNDKIDITNYVAVNSASAHPHFLNDGTHFNMGSSFGKKCNYNILKLEPGESKGEQKWSMLCSIPARGRDPSYFHSFGLTDNYIIYLEQPLVINVLKVLTSKFRGLPTTGCMEYRPKNKAYFHLINRHTGERLATEYNASAFFCFHHINAYEDDGHVVVDLCCYNNDEILQRTNVAELKKGVPPADESEARRFVFPLNVDKASKDTNLVTLPYTSCTATVTADGSVFCTPEVMLDEAFEAPRINYEKHNGKPYQYVYGVTGNNQGLIKIDMKSKTFKVWEEKGYMPSEPVFIGSPSATGEDDGVVLSAVLTSDRAKPNFLVVLNGKDFTELGRAEIEAQIPYGIHGLFVPNI
ncbi:carotenoid-cleaving dioxygenase, mitochondrial-like [Ptychodera flava]|uniref:carotenoid-cleaving dioxygenase, mitochondrial-like n=1 Tax=Ptychodera flava TaxID=63121 RepID=UPI00396A693E